MNRKKAFLWAEAVLCVLLAAALTAGALRVYAQGAGADWIYTREKAAQALRPALPLFCAALGLAAAGRIAGIREDEKIQTPKADLCRMGQSRPAAAERAGKIRLFLLLAAGGLILAGILNGSMRDVLYKAVNICTECVGLG